MIETNYNFRSKVLWQTIIKLTIYFGVLIGLFLVTLMWAPDFYRFLPFGGVADMEGRQILQQELQGVISSNQDLYEVISTGTLVGSGRLDAAITLFFGMLGSVLLMIPVSWVYRAINTGADHDHSLSVTIILLPSVLAGIVLVVQHSLALAFSLAGIAAAVRFRRSLSDTSDTLFVFVAIGVGIAAGISALGVALVLSFFFCFATMFVCFYGGGLEAHYKADKKKLKMETKKQANPQSVAEVESLAQEATDAR